MSTGHTPAIRTIEDLVQRARSGSAVAWGALYERFYADVARCLRGMTRDADEAHDLAQETFERARANLGAFGRRSAFRAWLVGIACNVARSHRRAKDRDDRIRRHYAGAAVLVRRHADPEKEHARAQAMKAMSSALDRLPQYLRTAFELRYLEGLSLAGAAEVEGITPTNMGVRAHRAKHRMRRELERAGWSVGQVAGI